MKKNKVSYPYVPVTKQLVSNNPAVMRTELDRMGVSKSLKSKHVHRTKNYFYRVFDNIASQLAVINQGLKDSGPKRVWEIK